MLILERCFNCCLGRDAGRRDIPWKQHFTDRSQLLLIGFSASVFVAVDRGAGIHQWNLHMIDLVQVEYVSHLLIDGFVMLLHADRI